MVLVATEGRVVVELDKTPDKTTGGIVLPETAVEFMAGVGKVYSIQTGGQLLIGDTVYFEKFGVDHIDFQGKRYVSLKVEDVLAVVRE